MVDIAGPLPICKKSGNRFIFTIIDLATRYPIAVPLQRHTAADIALILLEVFVLMISQQSVFRIQVVTLHLIYGK